MALDADVNKQDVTGDKTHTADSYTYYTLWKHTTRGGNIDDKSERALHVCFQVPLARRAMRC
jgi:hypothetical protein